ncbi:hypothetical protein L3556_12365 [Candidatus Synechococcus calcipolaris G9]|uniref:Uncharacterized protein n=1 Tax=Candidatus Synechococcus calcipolaris G9 TaxID=1497997 RepID=A0ABT6F1I3_9SYNE|nr:hypothetical protein [Candidatus Synechococcus calcipolaris]MDG2991719.1 hypothetical protein [Candidatus Synechococcus calcipolaris G9]
MRDNLCKYLAEKYPTAFTQWLLKDSSENVSILKLTLTEKTGQTIYQLKHGMLSNYLIQQLKQPDIPIILA